MATRQTDTICMARACLSRATPLLRNCGALCGAMCCKPDADGRGGMLLFPGEEALYTPAPAFAQVAQSDFLVLGKPLSLLTCQGECPRDERPLACRFFPLTPICVNAASDVAMDIRAWPVCPLMEHGLSGLSRDFVRAAREAAQILFAHAEIRAYIEALTEHLSQYTHF